MKHTATPPLSAGAEWTPRRVGRCATQLFLYCFLAYACSYIGRKNFSACLPAMIGEGLLTKTVGGYVTTAYMLVYGAGQLINGVIGSKVKPKYMIGIGLCGAGLCNLTMGLVPTATAMPFIWAFNGLFHSMLWAPIIRVFTDLLPADRRDSAGTNIAASCSVGAVLAFLIPSVLLRFGHWRTVFYVSGGILLAAFLVWVVGNRFLSAYTAMMERACQLERESLREQTESEAMGSHRKVKHSLPAVIIASGLWLILFGLFCNGALRDAVETWAPTFLSEQFGLDSSLAALISVIIPIVSITGTYAANWLHDKFIHNELYTACTMFAIATLCVGGLFLSREVNAVLCALFMAVSVSAMWGANHMFLTVVPYHFAPLGLSAAVTGFLNSVIYFATALCSGLYGMLAEQVGWRILILVWLGVGVFGIIFCVIGGKLWAKKRVALDEGKL